MKRHQTGLTLLEVIIALALVVLMAGALVLSMNPDREKAKQVISQLDLAKAGMLRYNLDFPQSTAKLSQLVDPGSDASNWNGPYIAGSSSIKGDNIDISTVYPESWIEVGQATISGTHYQAVLLKGIADTQLRSSILSKCGESCKPFPGRDDIGLLVQAVNVSGAGNGSFEVAGVGAVPNTPAPPPTPWQGPSLSVPPCGASCGTPGGTPTPIPNPTPTVPMCADGVTPRPANGQCDYRICPPGSYWTESESRCKTREDICSSVGAVWDSSFGANGGCRGPEYVPPPTPVISDSWCVSDGTLVPAGSGRACPPNALETTCTDTHVRETRTRIDMGMGPCKIAVSQQTWCTVLNPAPGVPGLMPQGQPTFLRYENTCQ